jgi:Right handed beta helix region
MSVAVVALLPVVLGVSGCAMAKSGRPGASSANSPAARSRTPAPGRTSGGGSSGPVVPGTSLRCPDRHAHRVSSAAELTSALATAVPGETIDLAPGTYGGNFVARSSGRPTAPITLCGSRAAVLSGGNIRHGYVFYLDHASWWRLDGFTVESGQKGVVADYATHDLIYGLYVHSIGDEAIHLRSFSSADVVSHCVVRRTGLLVTFFGEGIYVGSAHSNWCEYTHCQPDASDNDTIIGNNIAQTTAENIDIKEGTTGGLIEDNHFDGAGMVASAATAWVNVKGNDWTIRGNTGTDSVGDGFQVHQVYPGWGIGNKFVGNHADVNGPGYGIYIQSSHLKTVLACDNVATKAKSGLSNQHCSG